MHDDDAVRNEFAAEQAPLPSPAAEPAERLAYLEREVIELREANAVLKAVSSYLAAKPPRGARKPEEAGADE